MAAVHKYDIVSNSGRGETIGSIWWDGRKIDSDQKSLLDKLRGTTIMGKTMSDGIEFFDNLPFHFRNGYVTLKRIK